jgi:hypothetical protein
MFTDPNWALVIVTIVSVFVPILVTVIIPNRKEKKDQKAKLLAGLAALEKSRRTLLDFKYQFILQRAKNATRLAHYINNFPLVEKCIEKAIELERQAQSSISQSPQLIIPNARFNTNLAKLMNEDATLKETNDTVDFSIIKYGMDKIDGLKEVQIQHLYRLIFDNPALFDSTLNAEYSEKAILTKDLSEKLYFVANYNPGILIGFEQVTENLRQLNFMIIHWSKIIKRHQAIKEPNVQEMATHVRYSLNFSCRLYDIGVEGTLMSIEISMNHLTEYARTQYKDHKSFEIFGKSFDLAEQLMPKLDEASKGIKENLDSMKLSNQNALHHEPK